MAYEIVGDRLKGAPFVPAHASGGSMPKPTLIVLHDTADRAHPKDTVNWFASKACTVSAHFVVERDGSIVQMVDCDQKAFHAGKSAFKGRSGCNNFAIGVEIDNPGKLDANGRGWFHKKGEAGYAGIQPKTTKEHGSGHWLPYTDAQVKAVIGLCRALIKTYPSITDIATHWLISPGRKIDTNPLFPLDAVRAAAFKPAKKAPAVEPATPAPVADATPAVAAAEVAPSSVALVATSRKARALSRLTKAAHAVWISLTLEGILEYLGFAKSTVDQVAQFVDDHSRALTITAAILVIIAAKYVWGLMHEDAEEGRYVPSGEKTA
jgi:N-acetylmuramoyl-L-alanine amidase